jgi:hypothetical protein
MLKPQDPSGSGARASADLNPRRGRLLICASAVGCDARPAPYGPIKQIASGHGCGATHWEENALNPTTPKPNAARIINFVMGKPFCESGEPARKKLADRQCKYRDQCHKTFDLFARQLSDGGGPVPMLARAVKAVRLSSLIAASFPVSSCDDNSDGSGDGRPSYRAFEAGIKIPFVRSIWRPS